MVGSIAILLIMFAPNFTFSNSLRTAGYCLSGPCVVVSILASCGESKKNGESRSHSTTEPKDYASTIAKTNAEPPTTTSSGMEVRLDGKAIATIDASLVDRNLCLDELHEQGPLTDQASWHLLVAATADGRTMQIPAIAKNYPQARVCVFRHARLGASIGVFETPERDSNAAKLFLAGARFIDIYTEEPKPKEPPALRIAIGNLKFTMPASDLAALQTDTEPARHRGSGNNNRSEKKPGKVAWPLASLLEEFVDPGEVQGVTLEQEAPVTLGPDWLGRKPGSPRPGDRWSLIRQNRRGAYVISQMEWQASGEATMVQRIKGIESIAVALSSDPAFLLAIDGSPPKSVDRGALKPHTDAPGSSTDLFALLDSLGVARDAITSLVLVSGRDGRHEFQLPTTATRLQLSLNRHGQVRVDGSLGDRAIKIRELTRIDLVTKSVKVEK